MIYCGLCDSVATGRCGHCGEPLCAEHEGSECASAR